MPIEPVNRQNPIYNEPTKSHDTTTFLIPCETNDVQLGTKKSHQLHFPIDFAQIISNYKTIQMVNQDIFLVLQAKHLSILGQKALESDACVVHTCLNPHCHFVCFIQIKFYDIPQDQIIIFFYDIRILYENNMKLKDYNFSVTRFGSNPIDQIRHYQ